MPGVIHFEIPADNPERVAEFYSTVFGWKFDKREGPQDYWLITTGKGEPGIDGGVLRHPILALERLTLSAYPLSMMRSRRRTGPGEKPYFHKMPIFGVGYLAYCPDTEGNTFGMMQAYPSAK
jgi:predicted enzyme related to lactoylglutathione lyase